jgi:hypothetical protein
MEMKKSIFWLVAMFVAFALAGCGGGSGGAKVTTVTQQTPQENSAQHVAIYIANDWQNLLLAKNTDGSLKEVISGNTKVFPEDVWEIVAASWKLGNEKVSYAYGEYDGETGADLENMVNNDRTWYYVHTYEGTYYQIRMWDADVSADPGMGDLVYWADSAMVLQYQNSRLGQLQMSMKVVRNSDDTVTLHAVCGGNQFLALPKVVRGDEIASLQFVSTNGNRTPHLTTMNVDELGNRSFDIGMSKNEKGYLKVVTNAGNWVKPKFYSQLSNADYEAGAVAWYIDADFNDFDLYQPDANGVLTFDAQW